MQSFVLSLTFFLLIFFPGAGAGAQVDSGGAAFELVRSEHGVNTFLRSESDGEMSVRVVTTVTTDVATVQSVLDDAPNYHHWIHRCRKASIVEETSKQDYYYCSEINLPFPFTDLEVVARVTQHVDPATGILERTIEATPDKIPLNDGLKRQQKYSAFWTVRPLAAGGSELTCTVRTDAAQGLPDWLRRDILTGGPTTTVGNLRERLNAK